MFITVPPDHFRCIEGPDTPSGERIHPFEEFGVVFVVIPGRLENHRVIRFPIYRRVIPDFTVEANSFIRQKIKKIPVFVSYSAVIVFFLDPVANECEFHLYKI
ncbi:hypothetical protein FQZ97_997420 [compost metagenome]